MNEWNPDKVRLNVARELREIVRLWRLLPEEAEARGADREFPGGDALVYLAPAANLEAWEHRYETAESQGLGAYAADQEAELHPLLVLATWEDAIRDERDQPTDLRATVERAADYIRGSIDWCLDDDADGNMNFIAIDALEAELKKCRRNLEDVLGEGDRAEMSRVWCVKEKCPGDRPRLRRMSDTMRGQLDRWQCPECDETYDYDEFMRARAINLHSDGADRFVLVTDAIEAVAAGKPTVMSWVRRLKVVSASDIKTRRMIVWWPDMRQADRERAIRKMRHAE